MSYVENGKQVFSKARRAYEYHPLDEFEFDSDDDTELSLVEVDQVGSDSESEGEYMNDKELAADEELNMVEIGEMDPVVAPAAQKKAQKRKRPEIEDKNEYLEESFDMEKHLDEEEAAAARDGEPPAKCERWVYEWVDFPERWSKEEQEAHEAQARIFFRTPSPRLQHNPDWDYGRWKSEDPEDTSPGRSPTPIKCRYYDNNDDNKDDDDKDDDDDDE